MKKDLCIVLKKAPPGVDFALQKGRGSNYETVQKQRSQESDLQFEFVVTVKEDKDGQPDFSGPFVQGARGDRYVYVDIGSCAGQSGTIWDRRLKVPLSCLTWGLINSPGTLIANIPGTAKDGGPSCAYSWRKDLSSLWQWEVALKTTSR